MAHGDLLLGEREEGSFCLRSSFYWVELLFRNDEMYVYEAKKVLIGACEGSLDTYTAPWWGGHLKCITFRQVFAISTVRNVRDP